MGIADRDIHRILRSRPAGAAGATKGDGDAVNKPHKEQSFLIRDSVANILRMGSLIAIAVGLFAMTSGGVMVYLNLTAQLELERSDRAASQQADRIEQALSDIQTSLRDASVVDAARSATANGAASNDALRYALRERGVVNILDARVLPGEIDAFAVNGDNGLGFAATEVVIEAIRSGRAEIRVLEAGTPSESLAFAQTLPGNSGVLLLRLTVSVITSLLEPAESLDFLALAQRGSRNHTVLGASGGSTAARIREIPIAGSSLMLQWSRAVVQAPLANRDAVILGSSGVIVLMIGLLLRRRTRLARYLEAGTQRAEPAAAPEPERVAKPRRNPPRQARKTMVLDPEPAPAPARAAFDADDDEPPTVVAPSPDLPEWLRGDVEADLEELARADSELEATQPAAGLPFTEPGSDPDDELLEDFDTYQGVDPSLFRPDGLYGRVEQELTVSDMVILGQAIGSEAAEQGLRRICVGHDGRTSGPELLEGLSQGLSVSGIDVIDLGAVPAPVAWFAAMRMQQAGGVMVTGGERDEGTNGLEIVFDGRWLGREERRDLLDRVRNQEYATGAGERTRSDERAAYGEHLAANHRLQRPLRVVLDCGNAVNGALAPELFESMDVDIIPLNADAETRADQVAAFDSDERAQDLKLCVDNFAADLGLAFDRSGGRLRVVIPEGRAVEPARLAALLAGDLADQAEEPVVVADAALAAHLTAGASAEFQVIAADGNAVAVQQALHDRGAALGLHTDGAVCKADDWHGLPDAFHAAAWLLAVLAADERPIDEILADQPGNAGEPGADT
jgi:phosphomannomutase/phosphoglucomutase